MKNIFENLDFSPDREMVDEIFKGRKFRIERILSSKQTTGWQKQKEDEWVCLLQGLAKLEFGGEEGQKFSGSKAGKTTEILLKKGDTIFIPSGVSHRVSYTSKSCIWLCVFA